MIDIFAVDLGLDIFASQIEEDIFRYSAAVTGGHRWRQEHETAQRKATLAAPTEPKLPPAVEAVATRTEALKPAAAMPEPKPIPVPSAMDIQAAPPKPKPPKPKKPEKLPEVQPVFSHPNSLGFHESSVKKALETIGQDKLTPEQVLSHLAKQQGTGYAENPPRFKEDDDEVVAGEAKAGDPHPGWTQIGKKSWAGPEGEGVFTGLHDFLKGKKTVSRDEIINHIGSHPHSRSARMEEHENDAAEKWTVYGDYDTHGTYNSKDEAQQAADEMNSEARDEHRNEFSIEGEEPHQSIDTHHLEQLEEGERDLGGFFGMVESSALQKLSQMEFNDPDEAVEAVKDYIQKHLPKTFATLDEDSLNDLVSDTILDHEGGFTIDSPLSQSRHNRRFGERYDSEEEAQDAIDEYIDNFFEYPYSVSQDNNSEEATHFEEYTLDGPRDNYAETHVAMPNVRSDKRKGFRAYFPNGVGYQFFPDKEQAEAWASREVAGPGEYKIVPGEEDEGRSTGWKDGHSDFEHIDNPVVRLRHSTRATVPDKKDMLFLDEIQGPSDDAQEKMPRWVQKRMYDIGLKRALMKAVESGVDKLGWTTGSQQAERYNLEKHVDRIEWKPNAKADSSGAHYGSLVGIKDGKEKVSKYIQQKDLGEYVGQELAEKILANHEMRPHLRIEPSPGYPGRFNIVYPGGGILMQAENEEQAQKIADEQMKASPETMAPQKVHSVEGSDLAIGGKGIKKLYDKDLHKKLMEIKVGGKSLKSLGVKIGKSDIPNGQFDVVDDGEVVGSYGRRADAELAVRQRKVDELGGTVVPGTHEVWSIDITPELKAALKAHGVSLYKKKGEPKRYDHDRGLMAIIRKMPASEAVVYAAGVLSLIALRPMLLKEYSLEELSYLRGLVAQFG
jgi:hypothetical protein